MKLVTNELERLPKTWDRNRFNMARRRLLSLNQKNLKRSASSGWTLIWWKNAFISHIKAIFHCQKRMRVSIKLFIKFGPPTNRSFRQIPSVAALAS